VVQQDSQSICSSMTGTVIAVVGCTCATIYDGIKDT
jgi:hypothetical protein